MTRNDQTPRHRLKFVFRPKAVSDAEFVVPAVPWENYEAEEVGPMSPGQVAIFRVRISFCRIKGDLQESERDC